MKRISKFVLIGCGFSLLTSCASIVTGTSQRVNVLTKPVDGAKCELTNKRGTWFVNKTPGFATIHKDFNDLDVTCKKPGYKTAHKTFQSHTKPMVFGNVIFGGAVGGGIDVASGAAYDYPKEIIVPMNK